MLRCAVGATEGIFYIRAEYPLAVKRIREAIGICEKEGILGDGIMKSDFSFRITVFEGAGAFVCGEETALIASVEGRRGLPTMRPPYPANTGLWGYPTLINNVETYSLIPWIIRNGAEAFHSIGTDNSKGTKVFALAGKIRRGGLIEVPMGISLSRIVKEIGGGIPGGRKFKAIQIGGPSGGCIPASMADLPIDYASLTAAGGMMGSGGLIVLDETDCMVDIARYFLSFTQDQSCGRCTFCRIGTRRMLEILDKISSGRGTADDLTMLEELAQKNKIGQHLWPREISTKSCSYHPAVFQGGICCPYRGKMSNRKMQKPDYLFHHRRLHWLHQVCTGMSLRCHTSQSI